MPHITSASTSVEIDIEKLVAELALGIEVLEQGFEIVHFGIVGLQLCGRHGE
jgi:hypothetical protein